MDEIVNSWNFLYFFFVCLLDKIHKHFFDKYILATRGEGEGDIWTNDFHFIKHGPWLIVLSPGVQIFEDYNSHEHTIPAKVCSS